MTNITPQDDITAIINRFGAQLDAPEKPFALLGRFQVSNGVSEEVEAAFARAARLTLAENGVLAFNLHRGASDTTRFVVYERWKNLAALEAHLRTPYITALRDELNRHIVGIPQFDVLVPAE